jgi:hypothetical protein
VDAPGDGAPAADVARRHAVNPSAGSGHDRAMGPSIEPETETEHRICADPIWRRGASWGEPRAGHHEGSVGAHIAQVLANIDRRGAAGERRRKLRLIALVHDTLKFEVDRSGARRGDLANHHARRARDFAARHLADEDVLDVVELHDDAYRAWRGGRRTGRWDEAAEAARELLDRLGDRLDLYLDFYRADNDSPSKAREPLHWFERIAREEEAPLSGRASRTSP